jgi:hypothetical protein
MTRLKVESEVRGKNEMTRRKFRSRNGRRKKVVIRQRIDERGGNAEGSKRGEPILVKSMLHPVELPCRRPRR